MRLTDIRAVVRFGSVINMFDRLRKIDMKETFLELRGPARFDQRHHWRKDEAPDGHWPGLARSTLERRKRPRGRGKDGRNRSWPKKLLGRFPNALQSIASSKSLIVRSRVKRFSMIHQEGGRAGHGARIPRRQYLWISHWLVMQARKAFEKALVLAARRGS